MPLKVSEMIILIEENGWRLTRTRGSHRQVTHATKPSRVTVTGKPSSTLPIGTGRRILKQAGIERSAR